MATEAQPKESMTVVRVGKTSGEILNWLVSTAAGREPKFDMQSHGMKFEGWWETVGDKEYRKMPDYAKNADEALALMDASEIGVVPSLRFVEESEIGDGPVEWSAGNAFTRASEYGTWGPDRLTAGLRCFAEVHLGFEFPAPAKLVTAQQNDQGEILKAKGIELEANFPCNSEEVCVGAYRLRQVQP